VRRIQWARHDSPLGRWEWAIAEPDPRLRPYVTRYNGYRETSPGPMRRKEFAGAFVILIIDFGPPIRLLDLETGAVAACRRDGFVVGLSDAPGLTETQGSQRGIQVDFTLAGARRFFGRPLDELSGKIVGLDEVLGDSGPGLTSQLHDAPGWEARFAILDRVIGAAIWAAPDVASDIAWVWRQIDGSGGQVEIGGLADELGVSHRHLIARCKDQLGMSPKRLARLVRFGRVVERIKAGAIPSWAEIAVDLGYYDQAHLIRDVRAMTGGTPGELLRTLLPDGGGFSG
jgi:AraC-like DNA-binding protein